MIKWNKILGIVPRSTIFQYKLEQDLYARLNQTKNKSKTKTTPHFHYPVTYLSLTHHSPLLSGQLKSTL